jgi:hypothetical protein
MEFPFIKTLAMLCSHCIDSPKSRLSKERKPFHSLVNKELEKFSHHHERKFISHPVEFPIRYRRAECAHSAGNTLLENPFVGLSFRGDEAVDCGNILDVTISVECEDHRFQGQVVWIRDLDKCYELGLCFVYEDDAFRVRNLEQICHIEIYRRMLCEINGGAVDIDVAAREWIERFSAQFPKLLCS